MKNFKKNPRFQLEKFSTIFAQLGLVLVLFVVFISLEYESEQTAIVIDKPYNDTSKVFVFDNVPIFEKEVVKTVKPKVVKPVTKVIINKPEVVDNNVVIENVIEKPEDVVEVLDINEVAEVVPVEDIDENDDPETFLSVSKIPVFKGCENLSEEEGRKCLDKKMNKLVKRYFNSSLGSELGLKNGKHRIFTQFVIDKSGNVTDVKIKAPHNSLKKEVSKVVNKIPSFTPGEKDGEKVEVRYTLPITFKVD